MPMLKSVVSIVCVSAVVALSPGGRCAIAAPPAAVQSEPTNAEEAAAKKRAAEAAVAAKYDAIVATLSAEEQAWEKVLQQHLGGFYLPHHQSDKLAGKSTAWDFVKDDPKLPRVLLIGEDAGRIESAIAPSGVATERCATLEAAVAAAARHARAGDAVLLSPACASLDMFRDYKHRGDAFAAAVKALGTGHG